MNIDPHRLHAPDVHIWIGEAPMTEAATLLRKSSWPLDQISNGHVNMLTIKKLKLHCR